MRHSLKITYSKSHVGLRMVQFDAVISSLPWEKMAHRECASPATGLKSANAVSSNWFKHPGNRLNDDNTDFDTEVKE